MGQGGYIFCEWDSVGKTDLAFQKSFAELEGRIIKRCNADWAPRTFGYMVPGSNQYGRTTIMPEMFDDQDGSVMTNWRQALDVVGNQTIITGRGTGNIISEDLKIGWIGLAFPNKQQHITELRWQIGDRKYGRINIEEMHCYNKPAIIFEEGFILNEEQAFDLYAYIEGPLPASGHAYLYQRIVMLGAAYYKMVDRVLGTCGGAI